MPTRTFKLIIEEGCPVAAIVPWEISDRQLDIIYCMLPARCFAQLELEKRWGGDRVLATNDYAQEQLRRRPMLKPKSIELAFL